MKIQEDIEEMIQSDTLWMGLHSQSRCMSLSKGFKPFLLSPGTFIRHLLVMGGPIKERFSSTH